MPKLFCSPLYFSLTFIIIATSNVVAQKPPIFERFISFDSMQIIPYDIFTTLEDITWLTSSNGLWHLTDRDFNLSSVKTEKKNITKNGFTDKFFKISNPAFEHGIRSITQGSDSTLFIVTNKNKLFYSNSGNRGGKWNPLELGLPGTIKISKIWIDKNANLFIGTKSSAFFVINNSLIKKLVNHSKSDAGKPFKQEILTSVNNIFSFAQDAVNSDLIWIGSDKGIFTYNTQTGEKNAVDLNVHDDISITDIYANKDNIWFSTLGLGIGMYNLTFHVTQFYTFNNPQSKTSRDCQINSFSYKSENEFYVSVIDSLPAIFNTESKTFYFLDDSAFKQNANPTVVMKEDWQNNILLIKGNILYYLDKSKRNELMSVVKQDSAFLFPFIKSIIYHKFDGYDYTLATTGFKPERLKIINLNQDQNDILVSFDSYDAVNFKTREHITFAWKVAGYNNSWNEVKRIKRNKAYSGGFVLLSDLRPGKYVLKVKVKIGEADWRKQEAELIIIIKSPFWQTWWFWTLSIMGLGLLISFIIWTRVKTIKKREKEKFAHEKQLIELEARALRAQMNPHFIFNCLNSIKSLMQQQETDKGINYLTTFSKLIRTLLNNADKKEISLYDEIETCIYYLQLEALRFDAKFSYTVNVDENIDLKSIQVPALIIQPFLENAIWHGIVPRNTGGHVSLNVLNKDGVIEIVIDDNGIGRESSKQNKSGSGLTHQSKGVNLTQNRLELNNLLQQRQAELKIIDKKDENGLATGTIVILSLKESE